MNEKTLIQEMTGVRLFEENERVYNEQQCLAFKEHMNLDILQNKDTVMKNKEICNIYFAPSITEKNQNEQFVLSAEKVGKNKVFFLKRKSRVGKYFSEKKVKITRDQYSNIIRGSVDWMKESQKVFLNEFYCKMKLFQFKIAKVIKFHCEEIYLKCENLYISISNEMKEYGIGSNALNLPYEGNRALVTVRSSITNRNHIV